MSPPKNVDIGDFATKAQNSFERLANILGCLISDPDTWLKDAKQKLLNIFQVEEKWIDEKIATRHQARTQKDFATSDSIRQELLAKNIELLDKKDKTDWIFQLTE